MTSCQLKLPATIPAQLQSIKSYLRTASELASDDPAAAYWCRLHALQSGLALDRSPDSLAVLMPLMEWLEATKAAAANSGCDTICCEVVAHAHVENKGRRLFSWADTEDRAGRATNSVVRAFYAAGVLFDVCCAVFGNEIGDEVAELRRYAKWKAAYIHGCLKSGREVVPGPPSADVTGSQGCSVDDGQVAALPVFHSTSLDNSDNSTTEERSAFPQFPHASSSGHPPYCSPSSSASARAATTAAVAPTSSPSAAGVEVMVQAQKLAKMAYSALNHEDVNTAIDNLEKALGLLKTGR